MIDWTPTPYADIPPKGVSRDDDPHHSGRQSGRKRARWTAAVEAFLALECDTAEAGYDPALFSADSVQSSLATALRLHVSEWGHLRTIRRGDSVYLTSVPRPDPRPDTASILLAFANGPERTLTVPGDERLYRSLHYQRTRLGLGHVRIERESAESIRLIDTTAPTTEGEE